MNDDGLIRMAWLGGCLVLVVSALVARRVDRRAWFRLAALRVAIFAAAWAVVTIVRPLLAIGSFT